MPSPKGEASGLRSTDCITVPPMDRAAPARKAMSTRGSRMLVTMLTVISSNPSGAVIPKKRTPRLASTSAGGTNTLPTPTPSKTESTASSSSAGHANFFQLILRNTQDKRPWPSDPAL